MQKRSGCGDQRTIFFGKLTCVSPAQSPPIQQHKNQVQSHHLYPVTPKERKNVPFYPPHFRRFVLSISLALLLLLIPAVRQALADYLGPDRVIITYSTETYDVGVWAKKGGGCFSASGQESDCIICKWKKRPQSAPCATTDSQFYWYKTGTETKTIEIVTKLPEATISGSLQNCNERNGWCTSPATLRLLGSEPSQMSKSPS